MFGKLVQESGAKFLLQGTIFTDVEETVAGIKRQHNVLEQLGIDTEEQYGYKVIEPLIKKGTKIFFHDTVFRQEICQAIDQFVRSHNCKVIKYPECYGMWEVEILQ